MQFIYRLSPERPGGKPRPEWFSKALCLRLFIDRFLYYSNGKHFVHLLVDGLERTRFPAFENCSDTCVVRLCCGQAGPAFLRALEYAVRLSVDANEAVYLVEDDYLHREPDNYLQRCSAADARLPGGPEIIEEGLELFDYVTLYDHPDKYLDDGGPNPFVSGGTELASDKTGTVYLGRTCHWKETNSTTMTFACRLETLRQDADVFRQENQTVMPQSFKTFRRLVTQKGRRIGSPIPSYSTHCESRWLAPLVDWAEVAHSLAPDS